MTLLIKKAKALLDKVITIFKDAKSTTDVTNSKLEAVTEDNKAVRNEVKEIEQKVFKRLEQQQESQEKAFAEQKEILQNYISQQTTLLKLPEAFAEMVCCTPEQVKTGAAKKVCDKLGMNDSIFDKTENQKVELNNKINGGDDK